MDEATAAVDTDARIQKLRRIAILLVWLMSDSVAHRVKTILDSDYIEGMSDGQAAEFDTPQKLMDRVVDSFVA